MHHKKPWEGKGNKKNNHPSNLEIMNFWEHRKWHRDFIQHTLLREDVLKENSKKWPHWPYIHITPTDDIPQLFRAFFLLNMGN